MAYSFDTSGIVDLRRYYPRKAFPGAWENLEKLIVDGKILAVDVVLKELAKQDDELVKWVKQHTVMIQPLDAALLQSACEIMNKFPKLIEVKKTIPDTDPFVIALARVKQWTVVAGEKSPRSTPTPRKIPDVCAEYGVKCITLLELFEEQGWQFRSQ